MNEEERGRKKNYASLYFPKAHTFVCYLAFSCSLSLNYT